MLCLLLLLVLLFPRLQSTSSDGGKRYVNVFSKSQLLSLPTEYELVYGHVLAQKLSTEKSTPDSDVSVALQVLFLSSEFVKCCTCFITHR